MRVSLRDHCRPRRPPRSRSRHTLRCRRHHRPLSKNQQKKRRKREQRRQRRRQAKAAAAARRRAGNTDGARGDDEGKKQRKRKPHQGGRKGKTGAYATGADVLEDLAAQGHDLPARVLDWRQLAKLKSTYSDALVEQINPDTGRVHTSFAMAAASTGLAW